MITRQIPTKASDGIPVEQATVCSPTSFTKIAKSAFFLSCSFVPQRHIYLIITIQEYLRHLSFDNGFYILKSFPGHSSLG